MQLTFMSIPVGYDIGAENHPSQDQYICIVDGDGVIYMGDSPYSLFYSHPLDNGCAVLIPANTWHNVTALLKSIVSTHQLFICRKRYTGPNEIRIWKSKGKKIRKKILKRFSPGFSY